MTINYNYPTLLYSLEPKSCELASGSQPRESRPNYHHTFVGGLGGVGEEGAEGRGHPKIDVSESREEIESGCGEVAVDGTDGHHHLWCHR